MVGVSLCTATCKHINTCEHVLVLNYTLWLLRNATRDKEKAVMTTKHTNLYIFVEVDRLIINVVTHEEVVDTRKEGHLREGEDVHELFHCVAMYALQDRDDHLHTGVMLYNFSTQFKTSVEGIITLP